MTTITVEHLDSLLDLQYNATAGDFRRVWGNLGDHLWEKFEHRCGGNLLALYALLDDRNTAALIAYLNQRAETDRAVLA